MSKPIDLRHHFNEVSRSRQPSFIKGLYKYFQIPGMANLAGGLPFPEYFPFDNFGAGIASPERWAADFHRLPKGHRFPAKLSVPKFESNTREEDRIDLATTLQYGRATGLPPLTEFLREFTFDHMLQGELAYAREHADILLSCGNTDGLSKVLGLIGSRGDTMLVEEFCYTAAVQSAAPLGIGTVAVRMDGYGIVANGPGGLRDVLSNWDSRKGRRPHFMYTVSIGQNPTGATVPTSRRREIYSICELYDIIIIEDDPYWHLQYTESSHALVGQAKYPFLAGLQRSYLSVDVSGRVIRLDTFSKTIAPGCRLGWITAQKSVIEALIAATETSTQQPSGFVQAMVAQLLCRSWGMDGWISWLSSLRGAYEERMRAMASILSSNQTAIISTTSPDGELLQKAKMFDFSLPSGGMFVWVRLCITSHPAYSEWISRGHSKSDLLFRLWDWIAQTQLSLAAPGGIFAGTTETREKADEFVRICFAAIAVEEMTEATKRWVGGVQAFWELDVDEIEDLGGGEEMNGRISLAEASAPW